MQLVYTGLLGLLLLLGGCAGQHKDYEPPTVSISSFKPLSRQDGAPRFEIGLHIINPNRTPLLLKGIAYSLHLEDHKVLTGVSNELPEIAAYGEADIVIQASVDLLNSIRLISDLMTKRRDIFHYSLEAKLDPGGLRPSIYVTREGMISLSGKATAL
jgi:hypothetical protein